jgi:hypothetical protein
MATDYYKLSLEAIDRAIAATGAERHLLIQEAVTFHRLAISVEVADLTGDQRPSALRATGARAEALSPEAGRFGSEVAVGRLRPLGAPSKCAQ